MKNFTASKIAIFTLSLVAFSSSLASGAVNYSGFLANGVGARAASMGGAFTAISDNTSAIFYNSAGLGHQTESTVATLYSRYFEEVDQMWISVVQVTEFGNFGFGFLSMGINDISQRDIYGNELGSFSYSDSSLMISYSKSISNQLSFGLNLKGIRQKAIEEYLGFGLDLSILYKISDLSFGLNIQDAVKTSIGTDLMATKAIAGFAYSNETLTVATDLKLTETQAADFSLGVEGKVLDYFSLMAGYNAMGINLGAKISLGTIDIDYSYRPHELGNINQVELSFKF